MYVDWLIFQCADFVPSTYVKERQGKEVSLGALLVRIGCYGNTTIHLTGLLGFSNDNTFHVTINTPLK